VLWILRSCVIFLLLAGWSSRSPLAVEAGSEPAQARIKVLYDSFGKTSSLHKDWGYAALIEYGGKRILFDTGNSPEILGQNAKNMGIDLTKLDFVVMSHRHGESFKSAPRSTPASTSSPGDFTWLSQVMQTLRRSSTACTTRSKWNTSPPATVRVSLRSLRSRKPLAIIIFTPGWAPPLNSPVDPLRTDALKDRAGLLANSS